MPDSDNVTRGLDEGNNNETTGPNPLDGQRIFIGFGINDYDEEHFKPLKNAVRDVEAVAELLKEEYEFKVFPYTNKENTTLDSINDKLLSLIPSSSHISDQDKTDKSSKDELKIKENDSLIIYFAGHGARYEKIKTTFFVPSDGKSDKADKAGKKTPQISTLIQASFLKDTILPEIPCFHLLLIFDCCFGGGIVSEGNQTYSDVPRSDEDRPFKGILESLFSKKSRHILTSGWLKEPVPDGDKGTHSPFAQGLLTCLRDNDNLNFMSLVNKIRPMVISAKGGGTVITQTFDSKNHSFGEFVFFRIKNDRPNPLKLKQAILELNYKSQINEIRKPNLFNLYYLNGTELCGHHLFTHRFFRERKKSVDVFHAIPYTFRAGIQEGIRPFENLWEVFALHFFQIEHKVLDVKNIVDKLIKKLETENCVLILKVDVKCDDNKLELMLSDFWVQLNKILDEGKYDKPAHRNNFYLFVLDRRGHEKYFDKTKIEIPKLSELASVTSFPPILPIDKTDDLEDWWDIQRNSIMEAKFQDLLFEAFEAKEYIVNAIAKLCDQCERQECFNDIFLKQWMT